jgi:hypothetical protein
MGLKGRKYGGHPARFRLHKKLVEIGLGRFVRRTFLVIVDSILNAVKSRIFAR